MGMPLPFPLYFPLHLTSFFSLPPPPPPLPLKPWVNDEYEIVLLILQYTGLLLIFLAPVRDSFPWLDEFKRENKTARDRGLSVLDEESMNLQYSKSIFN